MVSSSLTPPWSIRYSVFVNGIKCHSLIRFFFWFFDWSDLLYENVSFCLSVSKTGLLRRADEGIWVILIERFTKLRDALRRNEIWFISVTRVRLLRNVVDGHRAPVYSWGRASVAFICSSLLWENLDISISSLILWGNLVSLTAPLYKWRIQARNKQKIEHW